MVAWSAGWFRCEMAKTLFKDLAVSIPEDTYDFAAVVQAESIKMRANKITLKEYKATVKEMPYVVAEQLFRRYLQVRTLLVCLQYEKRLCSRNN